MPPKCSSLLSAFVVFVFGMFLCCGDIYSQTSAPDYTIEHGLYTKTMTISAFKAFTKPVELLQTRQLPSEGKYVRFSISINTNGNDEFGPVDVKHPENFRYTDDATLAKCLPNLRPGDKIYFDDIKVQTSDRLTRSLSSMAVILK